MARLFAFVTLLFVATASARADALPFGVGNRARLRALQQTAPAPTKISIETVPAGEKARLIIPRRLLNRLTAANSDTTQQRTASAAPLPTIAFTLLGLLAFGAFAMPRPAARVGVFLLAVAVVPLFFQAALADVPPGPVPRPQATTLLLAGQVQVEVVEESDVVRLILNKNFGSGKMP